MELPLRLEVRCPRCREALMNPDRPISGLPSVELHAHAYGTLGSVLLSQIYGDFSKDFRGIEDRRDAVVAFSCPRCYELLPVRRVCDCGAPVVRLDLIMGGIIEICTRNGCKHHALEFQNADDAFALFRDQNATGLA